MMTIYGKVGDVQTELDRTARARLKNVMDPRKFDAEVINSTAAVLREHAKHTRALHNIMQYVAFEPPDEPMKAL